MLHTLGLWVLQSRGSKLFPLSLWLMYTVVKWPRDMALGEVVYFY